MLYFCGLFPAGKGIPCSDCGELGIVGESFGVGMAVVQGVNDGTAPAIMLRQPNWIAK